MNDTNGLKPATGQRKWRGISCSVLPGGYNTGIKIMSLQKTWGNFHLSALGVMLLSVLLVGCDNSVAQNAAPPAPAVSAADVVVKSISQWDSFNGRIEAVESVQLRPRVSGYIDKVNYTDGQEVKKGEVLFTIDDRTYRAALEQAQANLASQNAGQPGAKRG
jgi:multidrug efflux system membrane fusion protein